MKKDVNSIPKGVTDYYGKEAILRDFVLKRIETIYQKYGFEPLYTPIIEKENVFKGHHGEGEKLLFNLEDKNGEKYVLKYDSTVPLARVISMYEDIKLPYKRYQLQQSYRDDEIDKGHFREFIQCDGDIVGSKSLVSDAEFVLISFDGLTSMGFENFTLRLNHRKIIKAIAEIVNIHNKEGILEIQRAIDLADKINKGSLADIKTELSKTNISSEVINVILDLITITKKAKSIDDTLESIKKYFGNNQNAIEGISDLKEIVSFLPQKVLDKVKIDFTLARGADYYTGFILEATINDISLGAVLGGGRYDNLVGAFGKEGIPAVGMAFGLERILVAMKELGLDKCISTENAQKIILYSELQTKKEAINLAIKFREKYLVSLIFSEDVPFEKLREYCENINVKLVARIFEDGSYHFYSLDELLQQNKHEKHKSLLLKKSNS